MKKIDPIKLQTPKGPVDADTYYRWTKKVGDDTAEFFLHAEPVEGRDRRLFISEVTTGFTTMVSPRHPTRGIPLTEAAFRKDHFSYVPGSKIKHLCRSALHRGLANMGHERFLEARSIAHFRLMADQSTDLMAKLKEEGLSLLDTKNMTLDIDEVDPRFMNAMQDREDNLQGLHERLHHLKVRADQHGTMTGDTTDQGYERLSEEIEALESQIASLEGDHEQ